ncbi:NYN domain-containing protein, partial [Malikia spinosa]|uniref:NYN domain-containing protein n=1 Tax=Malikia spinosa TaxID=86180 RepID=UPI001F205036
MANSPDQVSMALFCDFENVALGVRDANYDKFDIKRILERLLLKGSIVVKKAYCDWDRYKGFKATMHEANFELIEIPHVRQSGKNSADIRLVVDALDLCYTKSHVNTFVIISGDSDFSPLVSKLRENAKKVIGVGVKQSTSDLLIANCDEFIFYDDLVRESQRALARRQPADAPAAPRRSAEEERQRKETLDKRRTQAVEIAVETFDALVSERGDSGKIWASVLKEAIKRRKPDFNETYFGFRAFGNLLEEAQARGLLEFGRDEKSGAYVFRSNAAAQGPAESEGERPASGQARPAAPARSEFASEGKEGKEPRRRGRAGRKPVQVEVEVEPEFSETAESAAQDVEPDDQAQAQAQAQERPARRERTLPLQPEVEAKDEPEPEFERPSYFRQQAPRPQPVPQALPEVVEVVAEVEVQAEAEPAPAPVPVPEKAAAPRRARAPRKTAAKPAVAATVAEPEPAAASPIPLDSPVRSESEPEPAALPEPAFAWPAKPAEPVPVKVAR